MLGASLSSAVVGKAPSEMSALKPYLGKRAVRNFREGDGNNGIMRSPFSAITLLDLDARPRTGCNYSRSGRVESLDVDS
jgi:hypothetical protein